jgi:hypothetical protein
VSRDHWTQDDWNNDPVYEPEAAEQARIDDYDRDRLLSLSESIAHEIAMDVARIFTPEWSRMRADFWDALAKSDIHNDALRARYSLIASVYREGAWQVERTRRTA